MSVAHASTVCLLGVYQQQMLLAKTFIILTCHAEELYISFIILYHDLYDLCICAGSNCAFCCCVCKWTIILTAAAADNYDTATSTTTTAIFIIVTTSSTNTTY